MARSRQLRAIFASLRKRVTLKRGFSPARYSFDLPKGQKLTMYGKLTGGERGKLASYIKRTNKAYAGMSYRLSPSAGMRVPDPTGRMKNRRDWR